MVINTADFLIIGGGIIGLVMSYELQRRYPDSKVILLEKEPRIGSHASGRNSGVLHAGFYYTADSKKARFTRDGNAILRGYCQRKGLRINQCGKIVVAQNREQLAGLKELKIRGDTNGVELEWIDTKQAQEIEPNIITHEAALWSPTTASVDPIEVVNSIAKDAEEHGVEIHTDVRYLRVNDVNNVINTTNGNYQAGYIVNCAGLFADRVAIDFGFSKSYRILPFKGLYLYANKQSYMPQTNVYPVPDLNYPFLGVHFTLTVDGRAKIGPTAIPALWREHYQGINGFSLKDFTEIILREINLYIGNHFGFRALAFEEMRKYRRAYMVSEAAKLLKNIELKNYRHWGRPGIRAQLVNIHKNRLEMDFVYEGDDRSFHVLNAVSPAFTCSFSLSKYLVDQIQELVH